VICIGSCPVDYVMSSNEHCARRRKSSVSFHPDRPKDFSGGLSDDLPVITTVRKTVNVLMLAMQP
jgi:hypothetical protein